MPSGRGLDQLAGDANAIAGLPDAAFQHITHAEFASDLLDIDGFALVGEARIAGDHEQRLEARQRGDDVLDHAVGEILLLGIAAHVLERQHRDRGLVGHRQRLARRGDAGFRRSDGVGDLDSPRAHRFGDVLQRLQPHVFAGDIDLAADLTPGVVGQADAAGLGNSLHSGGDVDAVAEDIVVVKDDIADVNADAEFDPPVRRDIGVLFGHRALDLDRAARPVHDARELGEQPVARGLDDAPVMGGNPGIDNFLPDRLEPRQRAFLVGAHQAAVAGDIRRQDCCKSPFHALVQDRSNPAHRLMMPV